MNRLLNNWELKLISLVLAVLLWTHVRGEVNPLETAEIEVPIQVRAPQGFTLSGRTKLPARAVVTLSGPRLSLRDVRGGALSNPLLGTSAQRLHVTFPNLKPREGEQVLPLTAGTAVTDVEILGVRPSAIKVTLQPDNS